MGTLAETHLEAYHCRLKIRNFIKRKYEPNVSKCFNYLSTAVSTCPLMLAMNQNADLSNVLVIIMPALAFLTY